jgi:hypothetical protein
MTPRPDGCWGIQRSNISMTRNWTLVPMLGALWGCGGAAAPVSAAPSIGSPTVVAATASASSTYEGWPASNLLDGDEKTSWFSAVNDSAGRGTSPFVTVSFSKPITIMRVEILGNRDPNFARGYSLLSGKLELLDASGAVLSASEATAAGEWRDLVVSLPAAVNGVKAIRFTSLRDEGAVNDYGDVALAELRVE